MTLVLLDETHASGQDSRKENSLNSLDFREGSGSEQVQDRLQLQPIDVIDGFFDSARFEYRSKLNQLGVVYRLSSGRQVLHLIAIMLFAGNNCCIIKERDSSFALLTKT